MTDDASGYIFLSETWTGRVNLDSEMLEMTLKTPCEYDVITKFFRTQADIILKLSFPSPFTLCNNSPFLTRSVQLIFSILLQRYILKLTGYFLSTFRSVQVSEPHTAMLQVKLFIIFFLKFKSSLQVKTAYVLLNAAFSMAKLDWISCLHPPRQVKYSTFSECFWSTIIFIWNGCFEILITLVFPTFTSIPFHLPVSFSLTIMPCSTASFLASTKRSSAYFTLLN